MTEQVLPDAATTQDDSPHEHVSSLGSSVAIWITLLVFTGLTVGAAFVDLGPLNTILALSIATFKAILVVLFFMHVKYTHEKLTGSGHRQRDLLPVHPAVPKHGRLRHPPLAIMSRVRRPRGLWKLTRCELTCSERASTNQGALPLCASQRTCGSMTAIAR